MDFQMSQFLEAEDEVSVISKKDHESLLSELRELIATVNQMVVFTMNNANTFAAERYSSLSNALVRHLKELEATRV